MIVSKLDAARIQLDAASLDGGIMSRKQHNFKMMRLIVVAFAIHRYRIDRFDIVITGIDGRLVCGSISMYPQFDKLEDTCWKAPLQFKRQRENLFLMLIFFRGNSPSRN